MRFREEREHEPCPHCGRNSCSWHMPGRICRYAYEDLPGDVKKKPIVGVVKLGDSKGLSGG